MNTADSASPLWTIKDVVSFTRMSEQSIRRAIARGDFPAPLRIGRLVRWHPDDVQAVFHADDSV